MASEGSDRREIFKRTLVHALRYDGVVAANVALTAAVTASTNAADGDDNESDYRADDHGSS